MKDNKFRLIFTCFMAVVLVATVVTAGYVILNSDRLYSPVSNEKDESEASGDLSSETVSNETDFSEDGGGFFKPDDEAYSEDASVDKPVESNTEEENEKTENVFDYSVFLGAGGHITELMPTELKEKYYRYDVTLDDGAVIVDEDGNYETVSVGRFEADIYDIEGNLLGTIKMKVIDEDGKSFEISEGALKKEIKNMISNLTAEGMTYNENMDRHIFSYGQDDFGTEADKVYFLTLSSDSINTTEVLRNEFNTYSQSAAGKYSEFNCVYRKDDDGGFTVALLFR